MVTLARNAAGLGPIDDRFGLLSNSRPSAPRTQTGSGPRGSSAPSTVYSVPESATGGGNAPAPAATVTPQATTPTPAAPPSQYDINTDPVLQQVNAITVLADQDAQTAALRDREQALLSYGDPTLAAAVLGASDPYVQAAGQNQESTLAQLLRSYHQGLQGFDANLDPSLAFSGYRVGQEGQIGQSYQDSLAQAAAGLQSGLGSITDQLNQHLEAGNAQRAQALADAYQRAVQAALTNPPAAAPGGKKPGKGRAKAPAGGRPLAAY